MATKKELQEKYANCKFLPKTITEQTHLLTKLKQLGFYVSDLLLQAKSIYSIYTMSNCYVEARCITCTSDTYIFMHHHNIFVEVSDLLKEQITEPLGVKDLALVEVKGLSKDTIVFDYIYQFLWDFSVKEDNFSLFMQAGEALAAALNVVALFSVKNEYNPGIGWSKESYNKDENPWIEFLNTPSESFDDGIMNILENYPLKVKLELYI